MSHAEADCFGSPARQRDRLVTCVSNASEYKVHSHRSSHRGCNHKYSSVANRKAGVEITCRGRRQLWTDSYERMLNNPTGIYSRFKFVVQDLTVCRVTTIQAPPILRKLYIAPCLESCSARGVPRTVEWRRRKARTRR
jgi:hypothetical protein